MAIADAQATIAALQARVRELEADPYKQGFADALEKVASDWASKEFRGHDEIQSCEVQAFLDTRHVHYEECRGVKPLQSQLTQRTAELEAAKREVDVWKEKAELRGKEACAQRAELERVKQALCDADERANEYQKALHDFESERALPLSIELERVSLLSSHNERRFEGVDKKYKGLHSLIKALPKVEGEIVAQAGYVKDRKKVYACFGSDADMTAYAALLQYRQGMEG